MAFARGIRVIELTAAQDAEAGIFETTGGQWGTQADDPVSPDDVALLVLTSGTTSRPKIVPLSHAKICASAYSWSAALALKETDRCLNVMPVFHGHGLTATVLASLAAGASVVCTPGYDASRNSSAGWPRSDRPGILRCRRYIKQFWPRLCTVASEPRGIGCALSALLRLPCRPASLRT